MERNSFEFFEKLYRLLDEYDAEIYIKRNEDGTATAGAIISPYDEYCDHDGDIHEDVIIFENRRSSHDIFNIYSSMIEKLIY